ncbi:MAG TPA: AAA family ATPase [bacterium]|nr:AAA family ATPase [bacterium]
MPLAELRIKNYRAFEDSGLVKMGSMTAVVGRNDVGKSALLHALRVFFSPPKKGLPLAEIHGQNAKAEVEIEVALKPSALSSQEVKIDAKNKINLTSDRLIDGSGLLRLRLVASVKGTLRLEALVQDVDDDALFPLATKNQEQLLSLLEAQGLTATRAGRETNQAKRESLRRKAEADGKGLREAWVDVSDVEAALREVLPEFVLFTDTADYGIEETAVQNQFKGIVDKALAAHTGAKQIEDDIRATVQQEFDKVYDRLCHLTDSVTSLKAEPKVNWKKAVDGIGLTCGDLAGQDTPYELRGAGIRRLFMVAYLQYEAAASMHTPNGPKYVFAVEEPEVHLHPGAQRDLIEAFSELANLGHAVVFTTHSPVFVAEAKMQDVALVTRADNKANVTQKPHIDARQIAEELGVEASDRLVGKNYIILVEGPRDVRFYTSVLDELSKAGRTKMQPGKVMFLQCGGVDNVKFNVTTRCMDEAHLRWAVLGDSDRMSAGGPLGQKATALQAAIPPTCSLCCFLERTAIENYLDQNVVKQVTAIDCLIPQYGKPTDLAGAPLGKRTRDKLKDAGHVVAQRMSASGIESCSKDAGGTCEFARIFDDIYAAFGSP